MILQHGTILRSSFGKCVASRNRREQMMKALLSWTQMSLRNGSSSSAARKIFPPWMKLTDLSSSSSSSSPSDSRSSSHVDISRQTAQMFLESVDQMSNRQFQNEAETILRVLLQKKALNTESLRVCWNIMDACIHKYNETRQRNPATSFWMSRDRLIWNAFLNLWRDNILVPKTMEQSANHNSNNNKEEICAIELANQLLSWSKLIRNLPYGNERTLGLLIQVAMKQQQQSPEQVPIIVEKLIRDFRQQYNDNNIRMNEFLYLQLLTAWTRSGREETTQKMEDIVAIIQEHDILAKNKKQRIRYYHILLQYWGARVGDIDKCEKLLEEMKQQSLPITRTTLAPLVAAFCRAKQVDRAEQIVDQMMMLVPSEDKSSDENTNNNDLVLAHCTREILLYYRDEIKNEFTSYVAQQRLLEDAERLYHRMVKILPPGNSGNLGTTLIEIYAIMGKHTEVTKFKSTIENETKFPVAKAHFHSSIFKALGNKRQPEEATDLLIEALQATRNVKADLGLLSFNTLINSWANSSHPDKFRKAFAVFRLLDNDPKCLEANIRPDFKTFGVLLKCLRKSQEPESPKRAIEILDEMERRYEEGRDTRPDIVCYALAIQIFLANQDLEGASATMDRMESYGIAPTLRVYNVILSFWANMGSHAAAERAEEVLRRIQRASQHNPEITPDVFSYSFVLNAWANAKTAISADRMWFIYNQEMRENNVQPNMVILTAMITFLAKTEERTSIRRADMMIEEMETKYRSWDLTPDHRHYVPVLNGWLTIGEGCTAANLLRRQTDVYLRDTTRLELAPRASKIHLVILCMIKQDEEGAYLTEAFQFLEEMHFYASRKEIPEAPLDRTYNALYRALKASRIFKRSTLMRAVRSRFENEDEEKEEKEESDSDQDDDDDYDEDDQGDEIRFSRIPRKRSI